MTKQLHLGGFLIASQVTHSPRRVAAPGSDTDFTRPEYYQRIGRILERGKFDFVFFADLLAAPARYGDDIPSRCAGVPRPPRPWTRRWWRPASRR